MLRVPSMEVKGGFETSNSNRTEIRSLCGKMIDELAGRTDPLEKKVGDLKVAVEKNKEKIQSLKAGEENVITKLESLENNQRRNNLRFLRVPEGMEGDDLKGLVVHLIIQGVQIKDAEVDIARDIQRVHRDPFRKPPNRDKPRKILVCFHAYAIKECTLVAALKKKSLLVEGVPFEMRLDLSSITFNKQWELGKRTDVLKELGATAGLKFLTSLRVMANNKIYTFKDCREVDVLIKTLKKGS
ncbi:hypothetical protein NDU88_004497 [Pleurodeles waltl]|uniref:L1 transposable element RRM domain-containing protein n=1 Tax=Pleurodeles waltl TaxID=8319 RepID=A0AAV7M6H0_PLEWA|nr:hypothetical protein NDU88_004497 [Pleurodeles waltl]